MSRLDNVALRLNRGGRWQTFWLSELSYLTDDEIAALNWADVLVAMLEADPTWGRGVTGWLRGLVLPHRHHIE